MKLITRKRYILHFSEVTVKRIQAFSESIFIELSDSMVKIVENYLFELLGDILEKDYYHFSEYFDFSRLLNVQNNKITQENNINLISFQNKNNKANERSQTIEVLFPRHIIKVIDKLSKIIHWTIEHIIESIIECKLNDIIDDIKRDNYDFLDMYIHSDLSKIAKLINHI